MREDEKKTTTWTRRPQGTLKPPDGGWGWMVVLGNSLSNMFLFPIWHNFTFIFKDRFIELDFMSTQIMSIVSLNSSFGMILGIINGPLLKLFGYRKVALAGITLYIIGILCTGIARSYIEFIIFYGLLSSFGVMMVMSSFSLAINSYFQKNRSKAVSYNVTITALGPIVIPYAVSYLLSSYGLKWTVFLLVALNLHSYVGALLLQPVKWHMKKQKQDLKFQEKENIIQPSDVHSFLEMSVWGSRMSLPNYSADLSLKSLKVHNRELLQVKEDRSNKRKLSVTFLDNDDYKNMMNSTLHMIERMDIWDNNVKYASVETLSLENEELLNDYQKNLMDPINPKFEGSECHLDKVKDIPGSPENSKPGSFIRFIRFLKDIYDLDLFRDPFYINVLLGLSVAFAGEITFSTMTPIILKEIGFGTEDTATFLSVTAGTDLLCRLIAPHVERMLKFNSKKMYLIALSMLLISRSGLFLATTYNACLLVSCGLGVGKGFRSVYWFMVLPDYVPLNKLASASAMQSLINGIFILVSGPLIGAIVTLTKSYLSIIVATNALTLITIVLWCGEIIYLKCKKKG